MYASAITFVLTFQQAVAAESFHAPSKEVSRGNVSDALATADHLLEGGIHIGGQEHFYLETQACLVVPRGEGGEMEIFSSTQFPSTMQVLHVVKLWSVSDSMTCV